MTFTRLWQQSINAGFKDLFLILLVRGRKEHFISEGLSMAVPGFCVRVSESVLAEGKAVRLGTNLYYEQC